jgi:hypothetical protein
MKDISAPHVQAGHEPYIGQWLHTGDEADREHPEGLRSVSATIVRGPEMDPYSKPPKSSQGSIIGSNVFHLYDIFDAPREW